MRCAAYPSYKPSGLEWLGDVPEQWNVVPLRRRLIAIKDGTHGSFERAADGVPLLSAKNVADGKIVIGENESMISREDWAEITRNGFPRKGDVLLTIVGTVGRSAVFHFDEPIAFQRSVAFLRFREDQNPQFIRYVLDSALFQAQLQSYIKAAAQGGTYMGDVVDIPIAFPSASEQRAIADFLGAKTAQLDMLIAKRRELIEKLKEKRTALISRTVTRGLPHEAARSAGLRPYTRFKDPGIQWLGDVPEHWEVLPLRRRLLGIKDGTHGSFERVSEGVPLLSAKNVIDGRIVITDTESLISFEDWLEITSNGFPKKGDVLLTIVGTIGRSAVFELEEPVAFQRSVAFLRFETGQSPTFIRFALESALFQAQLQSVIKSAAQGGTYMGDVVGLVLTFPPIAEQYAIADYLSTETAKIDRMVAKVEDAIERIQEYRTALITAAVTGKIDVRESAAA